MICASCSTLGRERACARVHRELLRGVIHRHCNPSFPPPSAPNLECSALGDVRAALLRVVLRQWVDNVGPHIFKVFANALCKLQKRNFLRVSDVRRQLLVGKRPGAHNWEAQGRRSAACVVAPNVRQLPRSLRPKTCLLVVLLRGYQIFGSSDPFNAIPAFEYNLRDTLRFDQSAPGQRR